MVYMVLAMTMVAVIAAGVHVMSFTAPALAEQDRQAAHEAAAERAVVPHRRPRRATGCRCPTLVGGIVLAFAVGCRPAA